MYKRKLFYFGLTIAFILSLTLVFSAISANITRENLKQSTIAQSLLIEHQQLSGTSYRLFKQYTDEIIFDQNANQAEVRNKQTLIKESLTIIRQLELDQREALGKEVTQGSVEDTDELEELLNMIIEEFNSILAIDSTSPLHEQEELRSLLEVTIDNEFREAINAALSRQSRVVTYINARINALNTTMLWFAVGIGALSLLLIVYASYWLFNQLYQPLMVIKNATTTIALGDYHKPITQKLDDEFQEIASSINKLALQLQEHEKMEEMSRNRLNFEVERQTSELTKVNLELTKIDARRRQFISDISHELRTPLTIIRGEAQVTLRHDSASNQDYKATLQSILVQAISLSRLVDDLLFLTRAEMNQINLEFVQTNIQKLVETEIEKWQRLHSNRSITLAIESVTDETSIMLDPHRMQQVISILLDNSIKYSASDEPIDVTLSDIENFIIITVKDSGSGISAAEIENIFERFVRFSKLTEGLGLGLPIAKAIIEAHRGSITVESAQDEGSLFTITIPKSQS